MHGISPEHLPQLQALIGETVTLIGVGEFQLLITTHPNPRGGISIEGRCELLADDNRILDSWDRGDRSREFRFFDLLGRTIESVAIDSAKSFVATFDGGIKLRVIDNSDQYESFSVGNLFV